MSHSCPDCGLVCYCSGDFEDHDTGDEYYEDCCHNCNDGTDDEPADEIVDVIVDRPCNFYRLAAHLGGAFRCATHDCDQDECSERKRTKESKR